ncbi:MAG: hypothetical protein ACHQNE_08425 [Candidatus Kapaibacterium sp.]
MNSSLIYHFEEAIAAFKAKRAGDDGLTYRPFYFNVFLKSFLEYLENDSRLIERFLDVETRLQFISVPRRGANLRNTCGAHKIDMPRQNVGARDGYRIIYYPHIPGEIHFLMIFSKADQPDLTSEDEKLCCAIIDEIKRQKAGRA